MRKIYFLTACLLLGCSMLRAQAPCSNFNDPANPAGNWAPAPFPNGNVNVSFASPNALDGTQYLRLRDLSGGSWYLNTVDFTNLGERFPGQCLCFDFFLEKDGGFGAPINPYITLSNGAQSISFVANASVTPGSGWVRVCAPLAGCTGSTLPSNASGTWTMAPGMTCADFNNVMFGSTTLGISPDITSSPSEVVYFDNICVRPNCTECSADFELQTTFSTLTNTASASLTILNPDMVSTPGNPGSSYTVNWGDGTPLDTYTLPSISHNYSAAGTYTVCVTQMKEGRAICRRCFTFCYVRNDTDIAQRGSNGPAFPLPENTAIAKTERDKETDSYTLVPNPAKNHIDIQADLSKNELVAIRIIDISGKVVLDMSEELNSGKQSIRINTEGFSPGIYVVEIKSNDSATSKKLYISE